MCDKMHSGAFVPYTVQVFASTEAGRGNPATSLIYTRHGGKSVVVGVYIYAICVTVFVCVCACVRACVYACVCARVCSVYLVCVIGGCRAQNGRSLIQ